MARPEVRRGGGGGFSGGGGGGRGFLVPRIRGCPLPPGEAGEREREEVKMGEVLTQHTCSDEGMVCISYHTLTTGCTVCLFNLLPGLLSLARGRLAVEARDLVVLTPTRRITNRPSKCVRMDTSHTLHKIILPPGGIGICNSRAEVSGDSLDSVPSLSSAQAQGKTINHTVLGVLHSTTNVLYSSSIRDPTEPSGHSPPRMTVPRAKRHFEPTTAIVNCPQENVSYERASTTE